MIYNGDCLNILQSLDAELVDCCITSPPYWGLRDYGKDDQIGLEASPSDFIEKLVVVFREVRRVLKKDGTLWLNLGDSYASSSYGDKRTDYSKSPKQGSNKGSVNFSAKLNHGLKSKDLVGIPWRVAFALQSDGWYLRQDIIWHKPNPMPESVRDRCTKAHEYIFLLSKSKSYYFDIDAIKEPASYPEGPRNIRPTKAADADSQNQFRIHENIHAVGPKETRQKRSVWTVATHCFKDAHFATYPPNLIKPCVLAGCRPGGTVLDPFFGSGTTGTVAEDLGRKYIGIELNPEYVEIAKKRITGQQGFAI